MSEKVCLQVQYAPKSICYGCGPANPDGLHISSFPQDDGSLVASWQPERKFQAFPGIIYGGMVCSLLDCHCNWMASWHIMRQNGLSSPPCTVTAEHNVKFKRPTPCDGAITMVARVVDSKEDRATVYGELVAGEKVCATCTSVFVAVKEGHPAFHRW